MEANLAIHSIAAGMLQLKAQKENNPILFAYSVKIKVVSHDRERFNCYLMERAITLDKGKDYIIEVKFKNLHQYPLSHVKSKLAFGLGGYYEGSLFH